MFAFWPFIFLLPENKDNTIIPGSFTLSSIKLQQYLKSILIYSDLYFFPFNDITRDFKK